MFAESEGWLPTPTSAAIIGRLSEMLVARIREIGEGDWSKYLGDHQNRLGFDLDYALRFASKENRILEIGAFPYFLTIALADAGFRVTALDRVPRASTDILKNLGVPTLACDLDRDCIPTRDGVFDVVIFNEVFEHLRNDLIHSVREIFRVLKPGGILLLSTPNLRSLAGLSNLLLRHEAYAVMGGIYEQYSGVSRGGGTGHVREYTVKEVANFLIKLGFSIERVIYRGCYPRPRWWHLLTILKPDLKPFFSLVARKPEMLNATLTSR